MTLPASGTITSAMIRTEMDNFVGDLVFPSANTLWLAGKAAAPIVIPTDYYGKTWGPSASAHTRFGSDSSPGSTWTIPSGAPWAVGDLCIVCQLAQSTDAVAPAHVIPAGWTALINNQTFLAGDGTGISVVTSYRIITAGQLGSVVTGMNGTGKNRVCGILLHFNRAITSVTRVSPPTNFAASTGSPAALISSWDSVRDASHLYIGMAHGTGSIADTGYAWSPDLPAAGTVDEDGNKGAASATRTYYEIISNTAPTSSVTMSCGDHGDFNAHISMLLRLK